MSNYDIPYNSLQSNQFNTPSLLDLQRKKYGNFMSVNANAKPSQFGQFGQSPVSNMPSSLSNPIAPSIQSGNVLQSQTSVSGTMSDIGSKLGSASGMMAMGSGFIGGLLGGLMDNSNIRSQNSALNKSIGTFETQLADLKKKREEATQFRRSESTDFLTNYITARDPNRSAQISQMYTSGQDRYRSELQLNDSMQTQVTGAIGQLQSQKQKEKNGWEIGGDALIGAAQMLPFALMG